MTLQSAQEVYNFSTSTVKAVVIGIKQDGEVFTVERVLCASKYEICYAIKDFVKFRVFYLKAAPEDEGFFRGEAIKHIHLRDKIKTQNT